DGERQPSAADQRLYHRLIEGLEAERKRALTLAIRGHLREDELEAELGRIAAERAGVERRLAEADVAEPEAGPTVDADLLTELRARVEAGLTDEQWQAIVRLVVRVVVHHEIDEHGERRVRASIEYRFPQGELGVLQTRTNMGSSRQRAG